MCMTNGNEAPKKIQFNDAISVMLGNLCNLTCSDCAVLSGFNFVGFQDWNKCKDYYEKWAEIIDIPEIILAGGEPYLHKDLDVWAAEFNRLWPDAVVEIQTNGTRLSEKADFTKNFLKNPKNRLRVSVHDMSQWDKIKTNLEYILESVNYYSENSPNLPWQPEVVYHEPGSNRRIAGLMELDTMFTPFYKEVIDNTVILELGGNQEESHKNCPFKYCYIFQDGLLFKCPLTTNYPEAKKQGIKFQPEATEVLEKYLPCDPYSDLKDIKMFIDNLRNSIPQCSLCAFDKKENALTLSKKVTMDIRRKKIFLRKIYD